MVIGMAVPVTPVAATGDVRLTRMVVEPPPAGGHRIRVAVAAATEAVLPVAVALEPAVAAAMEAKSVKAALGLAGAVELSPTEAARPVKVVAEAEPLPTEVVLGVKAAVRARRRTAIVSTGRGGVV